MSEFTESIRIVLRNSCLPLSFLNPVPSNYQKAKAMQNEWVDQYLDVIQQLENEVDSYSSDERMFEILEGTTNSGGTLVMHLIGNMRHFYGAVLLKDGYVRDREFEFSGQMDRVTMKSEIMIIRGMIQVYFSKVEDNSFTEDFPVEFAGHTVSKGFMYLKLLQHFTYHLGQINYHRRSRA